MKKIILSLSMITLMGSCGIYSKYERPKEVLDDGITGDVPISDSATLLSWREFFTDSQLQSFIERGLRQNTDLQTAQLKVSEAEASLRSARLAYWPSLALSPSGTLSSFDGGDVAKTYNLCATASWQLDVFGSVRNAKEQSKALYAQTQDYRQAVQTQLVSAIATYYYTLQMLDEQLVIAQQTDTLWGNYVQTIRALKEGGGATEASVAQAEANHYSVRTTVADLQQQIRETENAFCVLLAEPVGSLQIPRPTAQPELNVPQSIPLAALVSRPDVRVAERSLECSFYATNASRSAFYPSVNLSGAAGWTNSAGSLIVNPGKFLWTATASLVQPVFQNGQLSAQLKIAKALQEEALLAFRQTLLNAAMEVNNGLSNWQTARTKTLLYSGQTAAAQRAVSSTQLLMDYGSTTYLEVLTAQQTLFSAQLSTIASRYNETAAAINLYQALGGGQ